MNRTRRTLRKAPFGKALLATALAIGLTPILGAAPAYACSCVAAKDKQLFKAADVVFKGKVTSTQFPPGYEDNPNAGPIIYTLKATRDYKGKVRPKMKVRTAGNSASCGVNLGSGPHLVFADRNKQGKLSMNLCGGTRKFTKVPSVGKGRKL